MSKRQMNSADVAWLHMDRPTNLMVVNSVMWFDEPMDFARVRRLIRERLVDPYPRFRQRIAEPPAGIGVPSWVDDSHFDLDRHLHHLALPAPGDAAVLQRVVSDIISAPLDRAKPLWDVYLLDGYGGGSAQLTRMHHSIADGIALARVLLSMTDESREGGVAPELDADERTPRLGSITRPLAVGTHLAQAALHEGLALLSHPESEVENLVERATADADALGKLVLAPPDRRTVLRGELGAAQRVAWVDGLSLDAIKAIGHATATTVNDVLVTALTGALRSYLTGRDSMVDELRAMVPFNLRPLDEPLPRELGNRFGLIYLRLPVGIEDRAERLEAVRDRMDAIKHSPEAAVSYGILGVLGLTPPGVERRVVDMFSAKCSLVLTNVPGPRQPVYFAGTRVAGVLSWVPAGGSIGLGVCIFSYDGRVTVGVRADAGLVPDPENIAGAFQLELDALARLPSRVA